MKSYFKLREATKMTARDRWNKESAKREKKHNAIEAERQKQAAQGKENMSAAIDRLTGALHKEQVEMSPLQKTIRKKYEKPKVNRDHLNIQNRSDMTEASMSAGELADRAYAISSRGSSSEAIKAHRAAAKAYEKEGDKNLSQRHNEIAQGHMKSMAESSEVSHFSVHAFSPALKKIGTSTHPTKKEANDEGHNYSAQGHVVVQHHKDGTKKVVSSSFEPGTDSMSKSEMKARALKESINEESTASLIKMANEHIKMQGYHDKKARDTSLSNEARKAHSMASTIHGHAGHYYTRASQAKEEMARQSHIDRAERHADAAEEHEREHYHVMEGYVPSEYKRPMPSQSDMTTLGKVADLMKKEKDLQAKKAKPMKEAAEEHELAIHHDEPLSRHEHIKNVMSKYNAKHSGTSDKSTYFKIDADKVEAAKKELKSHNVSPEHWINGEHQQ